MRKFVSLPKTQKKTYPFHTLTESRRASKLKHVSEESISLTFWVRVALSIWRVAIWDMIRSRMATDVWFNCCGSVCLEFDHVPKWWDAWRHWSGNTWQTIYPILHAKSAAKQTQSQLFHPCFFTKILLWRWVCILQLDSSIDPKNPQSIVRKVHDQRLAPNSLKDSLYQELLRLKSFYQLDHSVDINVVVVSQRPLFSITLGNTKDCTVYHL